MRQPMTFLLWEQLLTPLPWYIANAVGLPLFPVRKSLGEPEHAVTS
jgi:hypothetical protein